MAEDFVGVANQPSGSKQVRALALVLPQSDGTTATVDQQVVSVADSAGAVMDSFVDRPQRRLMEMSGVQASDTIASSYARRSGERITQTDRRGSTGRGSTR